MSAMHNKKLEAAMSPAERASRNRRIARAVKSGATMAAVARQLGVSLKAVRRICEEELGMKPGGKEGKP